MKKAHAMIFQELCPHKMKNIIKQHPEYEITLNNILKSMDAIGQSMHDPICETYPYISLTESFAIMNNIRQQDRQGLAEYMESFKQDNSIMKISIGEHFLDIFVKTTKEFKRIYKVNDAQKRIKQRKIHVKYG